MRDGLLELQSLLISSHRGRIRSTWFEVLSLLGQFFEVLFLEEDFRFIRNHRQNSRMKGPCVKPHILAYVCFCQRQLWRHITPRQRCGCAVAAYKSEMAPSSEFLYCCFTPAFYLAHKNAKTLKSLFSCVSTYVVKMTYSAVKFAE